MKCFQTGTCAVAGSEIVQNLYHNHFLNLLFRPLFLNVTDCPGEVLKCRVSAIHCQMLERAIDEGTAAGMTD